MTTTQDILDDIRANQTKIEEYEISLAGHESMVKWYTRLIANHEKSVTQLKRQFNGL